MVTSQKEQIQSLIADIEQALAVKKPKTLWIKASEVESQRQVLVQAQTYLKSLDQLFEASEGQESGESTEDLLRTLRTEMTFLKSNALRPLRLEIDNLQSAKEALRHEVEALERQRSHITQSMAEQADDPHSKDSHSQIDEAQLNQFLVVLTERFQENLSVLVKQQLTQTNLDHTAVASAPSAATESGQSNLQPSHEQLEKIQQLQSKSEQLLIDIDSTLQQTFETLQSNISKYQASINEGIESIHSLGRQGKKSMRSLIDHLTAQLEQTLDQTSVSDSASSHGDVSVLPIVESDAELNELDTVASLDEILPREIQGDGLESEVGEAESATFIGEDSTTTVDLPSQDVDQSSKRAEAESSDSVVDAVIAKTQVAEAEAEDLDVESKVTPTADAVFLANLTISDLTDAKHMMIDSSIEAPVDELAQVNGIDQSNSDGKRNNLADMIEPGGRDRRDSSVESNNANGVIESSPKSDGIDTKEMSDTFSLAEGNDSALSKELQGELKENNQASIISALEVPIVEEDPIVSERSEDASISRASSPNVSVNSDSKVIPDEPTETVNKDNLIDADSGNIESSDRLVRTDRPDTDGLMSNGDIESNFFEATESIDSSNQSERAQQSGDSQQLLAEQSGLAQSNSVRSTLDHSTETRRSKPTHSKKKESALQLSDNEGFAPEDDDKSAWFLGIDLGTTGLSVVLMERYTHRMYELYWSVSGDSEAKRFRLPAVASVDSKVSGQLGIGVVGPAALQENTPLLRSLKTMLKTGIPDDVSGEPQIQWSERMSLPLLSLQRAVCDLFRTLSADHMSCHAVGIEDDTLRRALTSLEGVIIGYPTNWPDTYSFNIREAALSSGLVATPDQVFFVEDAIAALLSALPLSTIDEPNNNQQLGLYNCNWSGGSVVLSAGATLTEVAIANLPTDLTQLSYSDFASRSYTYAGDSVDQDIICQLLHLPLQNETSTNTQQSGQPSADDWESLKLDQLQLPRPGEANRIARHRLAQRLNDSSLGQQALATARDLKMMLQENDEVTVQLGNRDWVITRRDLETKVFFPYVQRINRLTSTLLNQKALLPESIKQVVCTGGMASLAIVSDWLRQQFPNATIIQDTYSGEYPNSCSRIAYGLANLCHYPTVLDTARHRYSDYFLLLELLRTLPEQPLPAGGIMHLLSERGVDIQISQAHLLALIEGHLPPGLVPTEGDRPLISVQTSDVDNYRLLAEFPLFRKQSGQIYIADFAQGERLRSYLESLLTTKAQSLDRPMATDALTASVEVE
ncbi:hypothetical protein S7335_2698 [Synechococcus sp. PCC 7335]|uniref:hypothetical protein n=1 Tax=Synechococcus sp. (strain ATCC 29403 / PCC 7335) TaxID=91464 RepID=UPI00017EB8CD|nr:hypothetical protein [Synechococcus sp. PCC 7335]EDX84999.1 hypothetical protein S7335_2698 [Synechococcus sp. PCC 7335]